MWQPLFSTTGMTGCDQCWVISGWVHSIRISKWDQHVWLHFESLKCEWLSQFLPLTGVNRFYIDPSYLQLILGTGWEWSLRHLWDWARCFMIDKPKPLNDESMIPQDYLGKWNSDLFGALVNQTANIHQNNDLTAQMLWLRSSFFLFLSLRSLSSLHCFGFWKFDLRRLHSRTKDVESGDLLSLLSFGWDLATGPANVGRICGWEVVWNCSCC